MDYALSTGNQAVQKKLDKEMERANSKATALRRRLVEAEKEIAARFQEEQRTSAALAALKKQSNGGTSALDALMATATKKRR
ncbi:hypothetical protein ACFUIZ_14865 [Streptomyces cinereoruber]|uniref:hypothetical protein n=1 Tax=Streptomyces cinereoruber TaxID=67260 RepID=UPI00363FC4FF